MSGLKRRLSRRRSAGPEGSEPTAAAPGPGVTPNQNPAEPDAPTSLLSDPAAAPTQVYFSAGQSQPGAPYSHLDPAQPPAVPVADLPPGLDPDELAAVPTSSARRGRLRKRVAFLRAARELLLRDLGGFVYELHRTARDIEHEAQRELRATKLDRLTRIDAELHELELLLDDVRRNVVVSEPGVGGECPECGELFGSAAHYCSHCGLPLTESARRALSRIVAAQPSVVAAPTDQPTQELPPLPAQPGTEFHWPPREGEAAGGLSAAGEATSGESAATASGTSAATSGESAPASAAGTAPSGESAPPASDASTSPSSESAPAPEADETAPAPEVDETAPAAESGETAKTPEGGETAPGADPGDRAAGEAAGGETAKAPEADETAKAPEGGEGSPTADVPARPEDAPNGRRPAPDDSLSRMERGT